MKKLLCLLLAIAMVLGMSATAMADYKIGIMTGTVSQNEEEYRAAEIAYNADPEHIVTDTYPDNFMAEQETTVSKLVAMAADPELKAIVMCQGVPGAAPAIAKIRETRDDVLFIVGTPQEDPVVISEAADLVMYTDEVNQGNLILEKCAEWGVDVLIHYSFPRHMAMELIVARHSLMMENAEALGIDMVDVTAPDPTAEAGLAASQQFIFEDVPAQMKKYEGKKVAFFTTNCGMQVPLQTAILSEPNAYYPSPCCPSPYHGFPSSLSLELDVAGGNDAALKAVAAKLNEYDAVGRYSTWAAPVAMEIIAAGTEYARQYINGEIAEKNDAEALNRILNERIDGAQINLYTNAEGVELQNYYTILLAAVDFNDYL
ncbi:DUF3798 domain-containing protein [Eubacteriales bacterium OttesenSCG-928-N13]|nr:DUF3798 domain-containing protein [Eubacteriales bacterium OttesenSCG-928-N13]